MGWIGVREDVFINFINMSKSEGEYKVPYKYFTHKYTRPEINNVNIPISDHLNNEYWIISKDIIKTNKEGNWFVYNEDYEDFPILELVIREKEAKLDRKGNSQRLVIPGTPEDYINGFIGTNPDKQEQTNINENKQELRGDFVMSLTADQIEEGFKASLSNIEEGNGSFSASGKILVDWLAKLEPMQFSALVENAKEIRTLKRQKSLEEAQESKAKLSEKYEALSSDEKKAYEEQAKFLKARNSDWFEYLKIVSPDGVMTTTDTGSYKDSVWQRKDQKWGRKPKWLIDKFKDISSPEQVEALFNSKDVRPLGKLILPDRTA
jgi:hypothetical protein